MSVLPEGISTQTCRFFLKHRSCKFGDKCKFLHTEENLSTEKDAELITKEGIAVISVEKGEKSIKEVCQRESNNEEEISEEQAVETTGVSNDGVEKEICKFYARRGYCRFGRRCRYAHVRRAKKKDGGQKKEDEDGAELRKAVEQLKLTGNEDYSQEPEGNDETLIAVNESASTQSSGRKPKICAFFKSSALRPGLCKLEELSGEKLDEMRSSELTALRRLFPLAESVADEGKADKYRVVFRPSDPDWPYDVRCVSLQILFPWKYPRKPLKVKVMQDNVTPEPVLRQTQKLVKSYTTDKMAKNLKDGNVELMLRPMLKWLDRNLEASFTAGLQEYKRYLVAKASGLEFISAERLRDNLESSDDSEDSDDEIDEAVDDLDDDDEIDDDDANDDYDEEYDDDESSDDEEESSNSLDPVRQGTEVKLISLQMAEEAASLHALKLKVVVQCSRCANTQDLPLAANRPYGVECSRCHGEIYAQFRPALVHSRSSILGYLDLKGCSAFDLPLVDVEILIACLRCDKEMSVKGVTQGAPRDNFCMHCHGRLRLGCDSVRFTQVGQADVSAFHPRLLQKLQLQNERRKAIKDPAIQLGKALPNNGTCKHYKKSYRWLRFPCCGKAYPCDVCHDEKERDHDMKYANRMICGWCCREQPFALEKPCLGCRQHMTYKASAFWEGGKGCRNKTTMSRHDVHKYSDTNKTVSKKMAEKKNQSKKSKKKA